MDKIPSTHAKLWQYFSENQKELILEGQYLMDDIIKDHAFHFKDYSFLIFPFAKAYEGYLKKLFLDIKFISHLDYISDHLRLGKLMSPNLIAKLGDRSLYKRIEEKAGKELANQIWETWKIGRNQIFHYFPHNFKAVNFQEAEIIVEKIILAMEASYTNLYQNLQIQK